MAEPGRLLVVDDNKVNRLLLSRSVEVLGHQADLAENGRIAIDKLRAEPFDLLLLDIEMPEMDGFEVLTAMKADPNLRDIPVIVTSSVEGLENIVRCVELGAEDYLPKPVNQVLLRARVASGLEKKRLRDEQKRLLSRFATSEVAEELQRSGFAIGGTRVRASILFCDIRGFTAMSETLSPEEIIEVLNIYYTLMFDAIGGHGGVITLMVGDGLMAVFGAPQTLDNCAQSAVDAAQDMHALIRDYNVDAQTTGLPELRIGVGIATGDVVAGYAGTNDRATYTCIGSTVNLAARLEEHTKIAGAVTLIDAETAASLNDCVSRRDLDPISLKGFSDPQEVCAVDPAAH